MGPATPGPWYVERARSALREFGLTAGTLGTTLAQTAMVALLPILLARYTNSAVLIGFAIGGEGIVAMLVPYWVGAASDHLSPRLAQRFGRRTFFLVVTAPLIAASVVVAPLLHGYWPIAGAAFVFFFALHGYLAPLWALLADEVPQERRGRVQGVRGVLHAVGLGFGLVAGGLLFAILGAAPVRGRGGAGAGHHGHHLLCRTALGDGRPSGGPVGCAEGLASPQG